MANYTFSNIAVEGPEEVLERIAKAITESDGYAKDAIEKLGLQSEITDFDERTEWTDAEIKKKKGKKVLFFEQAYPWTPEFIIVKVLDRLCEGEYAFYHLSNEWEDGDHFTNDTEGKYFPQRYIVTCDPDGEDVFLKTEKDVIANIRKRTGAPESLNTIEELTSWAEKEELYVCIDEIGVSDSDSGSDFGFDLEDFEFSIGDEDEEDSESNENEEEDDDAEIEIGKSCHKISLEFTDFSKKEASVIYSEICELVDITPSIDVKANEPEFIKYSNADKYRKKITKSDDWSTYHEIEETAPGLSMLSGYKYSFFDKTAGFQKKKLENEDRILKFFGDFLQPLVERWDNDCIPGGKDQMIYKICIAAFAVGVEIVHIGLISFLKDNQEMFEDCDWLDKGWKVIMEQANS